MSVTKTPMKISFALGALTLSEEKQEDQWSKNKELKNISGNIMSSVDANKKNVGSIDMIFSKLIGSYCFGYKII